MFKKIFLVGLKFFKIVFEIILPTIIPVMGIIQEFDSRPKRPTTGKFPDYAISFLLTTVIT